jgi:hypothetical protein
VSSQTVPGGVVHELLADLRQALIANAAALDAWTDITPLARNEFICWVENAKQQSTRERRIRRTQEELEERGQRQSRFGQPHASLLLAPATQGFARLDMQEWRSRISRGASTRPALPDRLTPLLTFTPRAAAHAQRRSPPVSRSHRLQG